MESSHLADHDVTELAWRTPKLDIVNEIAEREGQVRALRNQQRHGHSLSRGTAGSSPLHTVTSSPGKGDGDQRRDPPLPFPEPGSPVRCRQGQSRPQLPGSHASSLPSARTPGQCLLPPTQPSQWTGHLGCPGSPRSLPTFSVTHPLQRKTNTSAHIGDRNGRKHSMGKGTRRMLLACLIPAARPRVPASRLAVGNGTCFPSRTATGGGQSSAATSDRGASTPQVRGAGLVPPKLLRDPLELGWGAFAAMERMEMPHPTAHPVPNSHPSAGLGLAGNENCSKLRKVGRAPEAFCDA